MRRWKWWLGGALAVSVLSWWWLGSVLVGVGLAGTVSVVGYEVGEAAKGKAGACGCMIQWAN